MTDLTVGAHEPENETSTFVFVLIVFAFFASIISDRNDNLSTLLRREKALLEDWTKPSIRDWTDEVNESSIR